MRAGKHIFPVPVIWLLTLTSVLSAQSTGKEQLVRYSPSYEFRDGIYLNQKMLMQNDPLSPAALVTRHDITDKDFYQKLARRNTIVFYDTYGVKTELPLSDVWGYCENGIVYLNAGNKFHRLTIEGPLSRFIASATTYTPGEYKSRKPGDFLLPGSSASGRDTVPEPEILTIKKKEYLYDFELNGIRVYEREVVADLLKRDSILHKEYTGLSRRRQKRQMLEFIRRYNEKHPLRFPVSTFR